MQGFILGIRRVKSEDLIVHVLTEKKVKSLYRFYGARHSAINLGYKIDFVAEGIQNMSLFRLRNVLHLGYGWLRDRHKLMQWQQIVPLFYEHLKEVNELDTFYFELLDNLAFVWDKTNPKRAAIEGYARLLEHEGRLHTELRCFQCERRILGDVTLGRGFLPAHPECSGRLGKFELQKVQELFFNKRTVLFEDIEIAELFSTVKYGL